MLSVNHFSVTIFAPLSDFHLVIWSSYSISSNTLALSALMNEGLAPSTNILLELSNQMLYFSINERVVFIISLKSGLGYSSACSTLTMPSTSSVMQTPKAEEPKPGSSPTDLRITKSATV